MWPFDEREWMHCIKAFFAGFGLITFIATVGFAVGWLASASRPDSSTILLMVPLYLLFATASGITAAREALRELRRS